MREQEIICTVCPQGCRIHIIGDETGVHTVTGNTCVRGDIYARSEFVRPVRTLTTTVYVENAAESLLPVRTAKPVPKDKLEDCMAIIRKAVFRAPITAHQVLIANIAGTGVDLIASTERMEGGSV